MKQKDRSKNNEKKIIHHNYQLYGPRGQLIKMKIAQNLSNRVIAFSSTFLARSPRLRRW